MKAGDLEKHTADAEKAGGQPSAAVSAGKRSFEALFHKYTFKERLSIIMSGLGMSRETVQYKLARLQIQLLLARFWGFFIPFAVMLILLLLPEKETDPGKKATAVEIEEPDAIEELEQPDLPIPEIEQPDIEPMENIQMDVSVPVQAPDVPVDGPVSPKPAEISAVAVIKSPIMMRGVLGSTRNSGARGKAIASYGGDAATEETVMRALRWLKTQQDEDGGWTGNFMGPKASNGTKPNATGFVLLAFLSHGELPGASEEFGETVEKGLKYLIAQKDPGYMGMYALVEAYGMTMNPVIGRAAEKALVPWADKISAGKFPDVVAGAFLAMAAHSAVAGGMIDLPSLQSMRDSIENYYREHGGSQLKGSGRASWHITFCAVGLQYLGKHDDPMVSEVVKRLLDYWPPPTLEKSPFSCCPVRANYFVTMMYFNMGGSVWSNWNRDMKKVYGEGQVVESGKYKDHNGVPHDIGYWYYDDSAGGEQHAGTQPLISTCYIVQQLMAYYRYLPTYRKSPIEESKPSENSSSDDDDVIITISR